MKSLATTGFNDTVFEKIILPFETYSKICLKIKNKSGEIVPFILNYAQKKVLDVYYRIREENKLLRFIVLKARQEGVSTLFEGIIYQRTKNQFNRKAQIVAHEDEAATNLFEMFKRFHEHDEANAEISHSNEKKLAFRTLQSEINIKSAERGENVKRSDTIQDLHATEVAFWRDAKTTMLALLQTVPDKKNTLVVIESTANGVGGWFYDTWEGAIKGENDFIPIFLGWHELPEYTRSFDTQDERAKLEANLDEYEREIKARFNLTLEQLNWRRYTIRNKCNHDEEQFKQEYPITAEEAFVTTGRPVFDNKIVFKRYNEAREPLLKGDLVYAYDKNKKIIDVEFVQNEKGFIKIYSSIKADNREHYVFAAGIDVAEGLEQGDYSCIKVKNRRTGEICLTWHGHIAPDLLAEEQHKLQLFLKGKIYFNTEMNNHGLTTITHAYKLGVHQYFREDFSTGIEKDTKEILGTKTTSTTKPFMINDLSTAIRENEFIDYEKEFWGECMTFVRNEKGQMQAQGKDKDPSTKCFDDRVMAQALMIRCDKWLPNYFVEPEKEKDSEAIARPHMLKQTGAVTDYDF